MFCSDAVEPRKGGLDPADDFVLLCNRRNRKCDPSEAIKADLLLSDARSDFQNLSANNLGADTENKILG